jgi:site-specific recombinase XerD
MTLTKPAFHSFNELALRYVASHAATMSMTQFNRRLDQLSQYVVGYFGMLNLVDITPTRVQKFIYHLEMQGLKPSAIEGCLVTFRACMKFAKEQKWTVSEQLSRPLVFQDTQLTGSGPHLSAAEFTNLYQDLVQELSKEMFH